MSKKLSLSFIVLSLFTIIIVASAQDSSANVFIRDMDVNGEIGNDFTSETIQTGSVSGNYELVVCGIETDGANPFNSPSPGSWDELQNLTCDNPACQLGIWGRAIDSGASEEITCSWGDGTRGYVAGTIRYDGVDISDPIIDMACSEPDGNNFIVGPVSSEPGAQLVFLQLFNLPSTANGENVNFTEVDGTFSVAVNYLPDPERALGLNGSSFFDPDGSGSEGLIFPRPTDIFDTKICVLSLRMAGPRSVPTMSEWGLIGFAAFAGIAGVWYLRRRQATA